MFLKQYQQKVVRELQDFYRKAFDTKSAMETAAKALSAEMRRSLNWVQSTFESLGKSYPDICKNGLGEYYPRIVMKVPTGGGKTLLAVEAIREYQTLFAKKRTGLVVWIVPTETIYSQTVAKLRDKGNALRQLLDQSSGGRTLILEKGQRLTLRDIEENLVVLFVMIQSVSRQNAKEALKVFQDSGGYEGFFPADHRSDLHEELLKKYPNLDRLSVGASLIRTSLANAMRVSNPMIVIDEIHKVYSDIAKKTIDGLNPRMVLGLSATPKTDMNVLVSITGLELKDEEMVKLDMHILPPKSPKNDDWRSMLKTIKNHRDQLEKSAKKIQRSKNIYIRPIALIQVEATGKDQRGKNRVHSLDAKEFLVSLGINADEIGIKTSSQNDIEDVDLLSSSCPIRYLITKNALREGWDCPFAYILGIIPNASSDTAMTQLIGRILRQPNVQKTGFTELDESYIYYSKGRSDDLLKRVKSGFEKEGLEDLVSKVKVEGNNKLHQTKTVKIRKEFRAKHFAGALYLPVWVMVEGKNKRRRFSYEMDIRPNLDFESFKLTKEHLDQINRSLSDETKERSSFIVTLGEGSHFSQKEDKRVLLVDDEISLEYMTRRYSDSIANPFLARKVAEFHSNQLAKSLGQGVFQEHFSHIVSVLVQELENEKTRREESIFRAMLDSGRLTLAVSNDEDLGFEVPASDTVLASSAVSYDRSLYEDVDDSSLNSLERTVIDVLDQQDKLLWWFRNKASRNWYAIQGWQEMKIRPDFIAAKKKGEKSFELVYILESKGEHLKGNDRSVYIKSILDLMTEQRRSKKIAKYQDTQLKLFQVNDQIEGYFIEEGHEEEKLRTLFK